MLAVGFAGGRGETLVLDHRRSSLYEIRSAASPTKKCDASHGSCLASGAEKFTPESCDFAPLSLTMPSLATTSYSYQHAFWDEGCNLFAEYGWRFCTGWLAGAFRRLNRARAVDGR